MKIAIASVQRNRANYLAEWIAFHQVVGIEDFIIYSHNCDDSQAELLKKLSAYDKKINHFIASGYSKNTQIDIYAHCVTTFRGKYDAIAFIDGDEFLFSPNGQLSEEICKAFSSGCSAIVAHWIIYGSSGHIKEPSGLIINNFVRHASPGFKVNRLFKSIVRPRDVTGIRNPHFFDTTNGTLDEKGRRILGANLIDEEFTPSHSNIRINHYATQSWEFFKNSKQKLEYIDRDPSIARRRTDDWYYYHDRNENSDGYILNYSIRTANRRREILEATGYL
jgi:hypothetical protein